MPALFLMLWHAYYAKNYAGIIGAGLVGIEGGWEAKGRQYHPQGGKQQC